MHKTILSWFYFILKKKLSTGPPLHLLPPLFFTFGLDPVPVGTALHQVCNYRKLTWNPDIYKKLINLKWKLTLNSSPGRNQICASVSKPSPNFRLIGWKKISFKLDFFTQINDCEWLIYPSFWHDILNYWSAFFIEDK